MKTGRRKQNIYWEGAQHLCCEEQIAISEAGLFKRKEDLVHCRKWIEVKVVQLGLRELMRDVFSWLKSIGTPNTISLLVNNSHRPHGVIPKQDSFSSLKQWHVTNNIRQIFCCVGRRSIVIHSSYWLICNHRRLEMSDWNRLHVKIIYINMRGKVLEIRF